LEEKPKKVKFEEKNLKKGAGPSKRDKRGERNSV